MDISATHVYEEAEMITDELMHGFVAVRVTGKKRFAKFSLFSMCEYDDDSILRFCLNKDMTRFLLNIRKNFTQPLLRDFLKMNSPYSMTIWHLMQREMQSKKPGIRNKIEFNLSIQELRQATRTEEKFKQIGEFKRFLLDKAIREIKDNCGVIITYSNIKQSRTIVGFHFVATNIIYVNDEKVPQQYKDRAKLFKLKEKAKTKKLTPKEQMEYEELIAKVEQMKFL